MKIGIDMDNTICSTNEKIEVYENIFIKENNITINKLWNDNYYANLFLNKYLEIIYNETELKPNASLYINKLKEEGNEIYIITARSNNYVSDMYKIINNYCTKHNIKIDGIYINAKDKVDICINNNIDIMIEDSIYNYNKLKENNINTILFDENNNYPNINNRISSWNKIDKVLKRYPKTN